MTSSPTPALLPDARAQSQAFWDAAQECLRVGEETEFAADVTEEYRKGYKAACKIMSMPLQHMSSRAARGLPWNATPPASDSAVPAGKWRPFVYQRDVPTDGTWFVARSTTPGWEAVRVVRYADKSDRLPTDGTGWIWPSQPMEWMPLVEFAAAPKVASDTGAGLRKALQPFLHAAEPIIHDDRERWQTNEWTRRMLRITVGEFRALYAAALATPTDATGGATGGGEDLAQRLTKPAQGNTIAMLAYAAELGTQPGIARWLRSVDNVGEFDSIRLSIAITALALATTPGGDLLEQAARYREALRQIAETQRERFAFAASHVEWCQRIARDTLKPAGDGGEA